MSRIAIVTLLLVTNQAVAEVNEDASRRSIESALQFVDSGGAQIVKKGSCVNCHHSARRSWALLEAAEIGVEVDVARLKKQTGSDVTKLIKVRKSYTSKQWDHTLSLFFVLAEGRDQ